MSFPQLSSADKRLAAPTHQQAIDYTLLHRSLSAIQQYQHRLSLVVAAYLLQNLLRRPFCFAGTLRVYLASWLPSSPAPFGTSDVPSGTPALSSRAQALTESASPDRKYRAPAKQKKQRGDPIPPFPRDTRYAAREHIPPAVKSNIPVFREFAIAVVPRQAKYKTGGAVPSPGKESRLIFPGWLPFGGIWQWDFAKP
jgi:hypothetical protein